LPAKLGENRALTDSSRKLMMLTESLVAGRYKDCSNNMSISRI